MRVALLVFPGTNGEADCQYAFQQMGPAVQVEKVWHTETTLSDYDVIVLPGGSSYGDYLRPGALAKHAAIIPALQEEVARGTFVWGIGNGWQILLEAGILPGVLLKNKGGKFINQLADLHVEQAQPPFTSDFEKGEQIKLPIAHQYGNYYCDQETLAQLEKNGQIVLRYAGESPNGALAGIAALRNEAGNVLGMMPRPERALDALQSSTDGQRMFQAILNRLEGVK